MAHEFYSVEKLSKDERFSLFSDALSVCNEFLLDYFDGTKFKSVHLPNEEVIAKFKDLPVTILVVQRRYPWGDFYGEVGIKYEDEVQGLYTGWAVLSDEEFVKIKDRLK